VRLHHGCPTWFPPRKRERGRTIGTFGFLEAHKGVFGLLDVLRSLPGTDLVLHSHPRSPATERRFLRASAGLPVRWHRDYAPAAEIAQRLAATCDVLVFWYDEVAVSAASGAVRVALASGVPVLTSPTTWFADLAGATYQPAHLVEGLERLLADDDLRAEVVERARDHCHDHSWSRSAAEHLDLWESLEAA
jgi:glycosyltransferase involved in cell wall biosynthesis